MFGRAHTHIYINIYVTKIHTHTDKHEIISTGIHKFCMKFRSESVCSICWAIVILAQNKRKENKRNFADHSRAENSVAEKIQKRRKAKEWRSNDDDDMGFGWNNFGSTRNNRQTMATRTGLGRDLLLTRLQVDKTNTTIALRASEEKSGFGGPGVGMKGEQWVSCSIIRKAAAATGCWSLSVGRRTIEWRWWEEEVYQHRINEEGDNDISNTSDKWKRKEDMAL